MPDDGLSPLARSHLTHMLRTRIPERSISARAESPQAHPVPVVWGQGLSPLARSHHGIVGALPSEWVYLRSRGVTRCRLLARDADGGLSPLARSHLRQLHDLDVESLGLSPLARSHPLSTPTGLNPPEGLSPLARSHPCSSVSRYLVPQGLSPLARSHPARLSQVPAPQGLSPLARSHPPPANAAQFCRKGLSPLARSHPERLSSRQVQYRVYLRSRGVTASGRRAR